jgi:putative ABC transport system ATP-binding protein
MANLLSVQAARRLFRARGHVVWALDGADLEIAAGEFVALRGPSGSGKTSLFNAIGGLDRLTEGRVFLRDLPVHQQSASALARMRSREIGFVFQSFNLCDSMSALENVALAALFADASVSQARSRAAELLEHAGLGDRLSHRPWQLSGGQQQRVAIARALINRPALILADEPTGNLDEESAQTVIALFQDAREKFGVTILTATHDASLIAAADRFLRMEKGKILS